MSHRGPLKILAIISCVILFTQGIFAIECSSEIEFTIEVTPVVEESFSESVCYGNDYIGHGFNVKHPTIDTICYREEDCNHYTLHLKVCYSENINLFETICEGDTYTKNNFNESKPGLYTKNLQSKCGCDSTVTLHLDVISTATTTLYDKCCTNELYNGRGYENIKVDEDMMLESHIEKMGCISTSQLYITACFPAETQLADTVRRGTHYTKNNFDFITYSDTVAVQELKTVEGCDSIVTLTMVVYHDYLFEEEGAICRGDSLLWQKKYYKEAGTYEAKYKSIYDMDSIYVLTLKYNPDYLIKEKYYLNQGSEYHWHGQTIVDEGTYVDSLKTTLGCDSVIVLTVSLVYELEIPPFFTPDDDGVNDTWVIKNLECYPNSTVEIFDRFGRRIAFFHDDVNCWDGTYNGHPMPSDDYWYVIRKADTGIKASGHVILKRGKTFGQ